MSDRVWNSPEELLLLFSCDPSTPGGVDFCQLVRDSAQLLAFPELGSGTWGVATYVMKQRRWSPLVYWSRIKRAARPILDAEDETLAGLGLSLEGKRSAYALAHAAAVVLAADGGEYEAALRLRAALEGGILFEPDSNL